MTLSIPRMSRLALAPLAVALACTAPATAQSIAVDAGRPDVKLEIVELKRTEDGYLTLRINLKNQAGENVSIYGLSGEHLDGLTVHDTANRRKYLVVKDSAGSCLCGGNGYIPNGETRRMWAKYGAPPATTTKMDVYIGRLEPVSGVPITP